MATSTPFLPLPNRTFQFQAQLDGITYNVYITWNVVGKRWYFNILDQNNNLILSAALNGSPPGQTISTVSWSYNEVTAQTATPHGLQIGSVIKLTISGMLPSGYNGTFECVITGPSTFTYQLALNPGAQTGAGLVSYNINLVEGYFSTSTLVFDDQSQTFVVTP